MKVKELSASNTAEELYQRWKKKVFANDIIRRDRSPNNEEQVVITRGNREFIMTLSATPYQHHNLMIQADKSMREVMKDWKRRLYGTGNKKR